jgi:hypothetical protein
VQQLTVAESVWDGEPQLARVPSVRISDVSIADAEVAVALGDRGLTIQSRAFHSTGSGPFTLGCELLADLGRPGPSIFRERRPVTKWTPQR